MKIHGKTIAECRAILDDWAQPAGEWKNLGHALLDVLEDIENSTRIVMEERCAPDERHCTCVPILRRELKRKQAALEKYGRHAWECSASAIPPRPCMCGLTEALK